MGNLSDFGGGKGNAYMISFALCLVCRNLFNIN